MVWRKPNQFNAIHPADLINAEVISESIGVCCLQLHKKSKEVTLFLWGGLNGDVI